MKRPSREINIFSLSALDLFASALGAFILLAVIQFPYTKKNEDIVDAKREVEQQLEQCKTKLDEAKIGFDEVERCKADLVEVEAEAEQCKVDLNGTKAEVTKCKERLKETFLAIILKWDTNKQDIDLHVIDPDNNEFQFEKHNRERSHFSSVDAEISVDQKVGPGVEVWEYYKAKQGTYKIYANLYDRHGNSSNPKVNAAVYYRDGVNKLEVKTLTKKGRKVLLVIIKVNEAGEVDFE